MPCSNLEGKDFIKAWVRNHRDIQSIVDFGPGIGTYYYLLKPVRPDIKFIAVEIWEPYVQNFMLRNYYDEVIIGDLRTVIFPQADCAILGDVLEHLERSDAIKALHRIYLFYQHVILSIPWGTSPGEPALGNPHEIHKSFWTFDEVCELVGDEFTIKKNFSLGGVFIK